MSTYDTRIDLKVSNNSHTRLILLTGEGRRVLEIGPAAGAMTKVLRDQGCTVTAIEVDPAAAALAAPYCERMIVADVETLDLTDALAGERFDAVIFGDVLEHLRDPSSVLEQVHGVLGEGGRVLASIPNVAHASVRLSLLLGRFHYTDRGLLDRTHLRFFTKEAIEQLFEEAAYRITRWERVVLEVFDTEVDLSKDDLPPMIVEAVHGEPEALTYQFIVEAQPSTRRQRADAPPAASEQPLPALWRAEQPDLELIDRLAEARAALELRDAQIGQRDAALRALERRLGALEGSRLVRMAAAVSRFRNRRRRQPPGSGMLPGI